MLGGRLGGVRGGPLTLLVTAVCYAAYVLSLMAIPAVRYRAPDTPDTPDVAESRPSAWRFLRNSPVLLLIGLVTLFFNLTYGPLEPALPVMVDRVYHAGAGTLGLIWSSFAVGSLVGTLLWSHFRPPWGLRWFLAGVILGWGLFSGLAGLTTLPWHVVLRGPGVLPIQYCGGDLATATHPRPSAWERVWPIPVGDKFRTTDWPTHRGTPGQCRGCRGDDDHWRGRHCATRTDRRLAARSLGAGAWRIRVSIVQRSPVLLLNTIVRHADKVLMGANVPDCPASNGRTHGVSPPFHAG